MGRTLPEPVTEEEDPSREVAVGPFEESLQSGVWTQVEPGAVGSGWEVALLLEAAIWESGVG